MKDLFHSFKHASERMQIFMSIVSESALPAPARPLTVIELFQSQGCSSCPPTNANVLKLIEDPHLLILTYDVTYWDRLGWKDTFGNSAFDRRQWEYARALQKKNVYTPQVGVVYDMS